MLLQVFAEIAENLFRKHMITNLRILPVWCYFQKQPSRGVLRKRCSENIHEFAEYFQSTIL